MRNFIYNTPTKVYFGKDTHKDAGKIIRELGYKKIMLHYGQGSIKKSGLYDEVVESLNANDISFIEVGGVEPNPKVSYVRETIKIAKENKVEMILAVGGGSVIDSSKSIAAGSMADFDVWKFFEGEEVLTKSLPVSCILTHSAAGSEMSASAVLTNMELNMKRGFTSELNRCEFSILNPELTYSVSKYQTACGIVDIMAHTMERYFTVCPPTELTDRIAESILKSVINAGKIVMNDEKNYDARATIMWASSLSHNGLTGCGRENALAVHQLEHALSGEYDFVPHGAGLAVLFPKWAKYVYKENIERFAQFARRVWDVEEKDDEKAALMGIIKMEEFFKFLKMPLSLNEFNIDESCIERLATLCTFNKKRTIKSYIELDFDNIKEIFETCF